VNDGLPAAAAAAVSVRLWLWLWLLLLHRLIADTGGEWMDEGDRDDE
jgi:hypothetical protein